MKLKPIIFGATGMVGRGVLLECLEHPDVERILVIGRKSCGEQHVKLSEIINSDYNDLSAIEEQLKGYNACFFCIGVSAAGMSEQEYHVVTHDYAVTAGKAVLKHNKDVTYCLLSGAGADETGKSRMMWARVKGYAENALKKLPFKGVYFFRPAFIQSMKGVKPSYKLYKIFGPLLPLIKLLLPNYVTTTKEFGLAMIRAAIEGVDKQTLESRDIVRLGRGYRR